VLGGLYLNVASRAAQAGRDLQALEARKEELHQQNSELRAELARLRSVVRLTNRAQAMGFIPAGPQHIEYLAVPHFPHTLEIPPPPRAYVPPPAPGTLAVLGEWLAGAMHSLSLMVGESGLVNGAGAAQ
jgi:hypothetical protein